jgi:PAS domain S-box-containing protein
VAHGLPTCDSDARCYAYEAMVVHRSAVLGLILAGAAVALAVLLRLAAEPMLGGRTPYLFLFPAVLITGWYAGRWPAYAALVLGSFGTYLVVPSTNEAVRETPDAYWLGLAVFVMTSVTVIELTMAMRRAEQRGHHAIERLDLALATGHMGVFEWDLRTDQVWWSDSLEPVYGLPRGAFGRTLDAFRQLIHADDRGKLDSALAQAIATRGDFEVEFRFLRPDGSVRWMNTSGRVFSDVHGRPLRTVGTSRDITAQREAAVALRAVKDRFEALVSHAPLIVYAKDRDGRYLMVNGQWAESVGIPHDQALGKTDDELFPPELAALASAHDQQVLATGEPVQYEHDLALPGRTSTFLMIKFPLRDEEGLPVAVCGIASDITARKDAEAALKQADRRKDEFLAILAHELRNPLAPIRLALEMLRTCDGDAEHSARAMDIMGRQLGHLVRLIDDLLDVSRITRGKLELRRSRVSLAEIVRTAVETSRPQIEAAGHELVVDLADSSIELYADLTRIAQVISNLLNNAGKYTPRGGTIRLTARHHAGQIEIEVSDNGRGIAAEDLTRVFDMFAQVGPLTTRGHGGLGIGLALSRALVEMHGGTIEAASEGLGKGSTFTVHLPPADPGEVRPSVPELEIPTTQGLRVLVADDNRDAIDTLSLFLERCGHTVLTASDGREALEAAASFHPDVCVLDIGMPDVDGYEVARTLRAHGRTPVLIALTGWGQAEDHRRSREAGFDYHLIKPVQPATLIKLLAAARRAS